MDLQELLAMEIGKKVDINEWSDFVRVPGGWVYNTYSANEYSESAAVSVACCFVPEPPGAYAVKTLSGL